MSAVTVRAKLRTAARVTTERHDQAALHMSLSIDGCATGVQATLPYRCVGAGWLAARAAERLRSGLEVTVYCAGFGPDQDGRLRLFGVDHVTQCEGTPA